MPTETAPDGTQFRDTAGAGPSGTNGRHVMSKTRLVRRGIVVATIDAAPVTETAIVGDPTRTDPGAPVVDAAPVVAVVAPPAAFPWSFVNADRVRVTVTFPPFVVALANVFRGYDSATMLVSLNGDTDVARANRVRVSGEIRTAMDAAHVPGYNAVPGPNRGAMGANVTDTQNDIAAAYAFAFGGFGFAPGSGLIVCAWHALIGRHACDFIGVHWDYGRSTSRDFIHGSHQSATFACGGSATWAIMTQNTGRPDTVPAS